MAEDMLMPRWRKEPEGQKTDRRSRKTRAALTEALLDLMAEKPLRSITVTELTRTADVNRATFYVHYQDVFDMFEHVKAEIFQICIDLIDSHAAEIAADDFEPLLLDLFEYSSTNENLLSLALSENGDGAMFSELTDVLHSRCIAAARPFDTLQRDSALKGVVRENEALCEQLCELQFQYIAGGVASILRSWLAGGRTIPAETMAKVTNRFIGNDNTELLQANILAATK